MSVFIKVGDANLLAFKNNAKRQDVVAKKQEILDSIFALHNLEPTSILCFGFSSFVFADFVGEIAVTCVSDEVQAYLKSQKVKFRHIPEQDLEKYSKQFQVVIAADEYFTYAKTDQDQRDQVVDICNLASEFVITTLRDYKNQDYKDREFSLPSVVKNGDESLIFLESHAWDVRDRASWNSIIYNIVQKTNQLITFGTFD